MFETVDYSKRPERKCCARKCVFLLCSCVINENIRMRLCSSYVKCKFGHVRFDLILIVYDVISCKNIKGLTTDTGGGGAK